MEAVEKKAWYLEPKFLFVIFTLSNTLLFIDRGIVPGASNEFNAFIKDNVDTSTPNVFLGLLQSAFIVGLAVGSSIFGHLVHYYPRFYLTGLGCSIWMLAVILSGIAGYADSYAFLVLARMLSGVGEASLQVNIPPWIQKTAPAAEKGIWLSVFFTAIPVGTATGYAYSAIMAENLRWEWAYFVEAIVMAPLVLFMFTIAHHYPLDHKHLPDDVGQDISGIYTTSDGPEKSIGSYTAPQPSSRSSSKDKQVQKDSFCEPSGKLQIQQIAGPNEDERLRVRSTGSNTSNSSNKLRTEMANPVDGSADPPLKRAPTVLEEFGAVLSKPLFLCLVAGYAAQTATLIGLSTFGSSLLMGLNYFDTESAASTVFGALICMSGIIATPLGGLVLDRMLATATRQCQPQLTLDAEAAISSAIGDEVRNAVHSGEVTAASMSDSSGVSAEQRAQLDSMFQEGSSMNSRTGPNNLPDLPGEDSALLKRRKMDKIAQLTTLSSVAGAVLLCICYWLNSRFAFLALVTVGVGILFFCTPAINMGFMLSVPTGKSRFVAVLHCAVLELCDSLCCIIFDVLPWLFSAADHQSFALAMMVVFMHALGDVPSPILVGLIKDTLAPGCVGKRCLLF